MNDLIEALTILSKYNNKPYPTNCSHDYLYVVDIPEETVSTEDLKKLSELGFEPDEDCDGFSSSKFGSC